MSVPRVTSWRSSTLFVVSAGAVLVAERVGRSAELAGHRGVGVALRDVVRVDDRVAAVGS